METRRQVFAPEVLLEEYRCLLQEDGVTALPLRITGNSMSPFLIHGRDTIYLSRLTRPVKRGDVLLYQRRNGAYVLHRVYRVAGDQLVLVGDAQTELETGIGLDQVIAILTAADRKGKRLTPGSFWWEFFEKVWIRIVPLRRPLRRIYAVWEGLRKKR